MSERQTNPIPHFLRVVRAVAKVSGAAIPVTALVTTVVPGCYSGCAMGDEPYAGSGGNGVIAPDGGDGGTGGTGGKGGSGGSGNDGGPVGLPPAPDAGDGG